MASDPPALDAPPLPRPSLVEQGDSPIEESHYLCSGGLRQVKPYLFDFICSVKPRFAGAKLVEFMASEFPSMPREYYRAAAEAGRLRQERGAGRRRRSEKKPGGEKKEESSKGETQQETKRVKSVPEEEEEKKSGVVVGAEEEEERQQQQQQESDVELVDNATIRHLLHRHEPPALDLGPVRVLGYSAEAGLWAVGKPPGMPVHAAGGFRKNTVCGVLEAAARAAGRGPPPPASASTNAPPPPSPPPSSSSSPASLAPSVVPWPVYLHPLHRLDKPVSGVLLFAESSAAAERARAQLAADRRGGGGGSGSGVRKVYVARVRGVFPSRLSELATEEMLRCSVAIADAEEEEEEGEEGEGKEEEGEGEERKGFTLDVALGWDSAAHRAKCFPEGPKYLSSSDSAAAAEDPPPPAADAAASSPPPLSGRAGAPRTAATSFSLLSTAADGLTSLVECRPLSGRTHQIRAHLGFLGHPIANDALYYETTAEASAAASALYPGPERPRLEAHGGGRGAGEGGAGCCPAAAAGGGREGEEENGGRSSSSSSSNNACISAADVAEILDQCGWVVGGGDEEAGGGAAAAKKAEVDVDEEKNPEPPLSPLEAGALSACPFCPSLARPAAASELRPLWLHARSYRGAGWSFECPAPRWASEGFVPRRRSL